MASSSMMTPPLRLIVAATPAPIVRVEFAALVTASTLQSVMSPRSMAIVAWPTLSFMSSLLAPAFLGLGRLPRLLELVLRYLGHRLSSRAQLSLHVGEASTKFFDRATERVLRVDRREPGDVDQREEHVAELLTNSTPIAAGHGRGGFAHFFFDLRPRGLGIRPVEIDARGLGLHALGAQQRRQGPRHAVDHGAWSSGRVSLALLQDFPLRQRLARRRDRRIAEDMG